MSIVSNVKFISDILCDNSACLLKLEPRMAERLRIVGMNVAEKESRLNILYQLMRYLSDSTFIGVVSKQYMFNRYSSVQSALDKINATLPKKERIKFSAARSKLDYDNKWLSKRLGESYVDDLIHNNSIDIGSYRERLYTIAVEPKNREKLSDYLIIELDESHYTAEKQSDEDIQDFIYKFEPYTKTRANEVKTIFSPEIIGYAAYLLNAPEEDLDQSQIEDAQELKKLLQEGETTVHYGNLDSIFGDG